MRSHACIHACMHSYQAPPADEASRILHMHVYLRRGVWLGVFTSTL